MMNVTLYISSRYSWKPRHLRRLVRLLSWSNPKVRTNGMEWYNNQLEHACIITVDTPDFATLRKTWRRIRRTLHRSHPDLECCWVEHPTGSSCIYDLPYGKYKGDTQ